jgi:hypothetical protein
VKPIALALALLMAATAFAQDVPPPVRRKPDLKYVASGAVLFGFFYTLSLALAIRYEEGELALPVLGPLIDLRRCRECTSNAVEQGVVAGLVLDAVLQAAGASLFAVGIVRRKPLRVSVTPTANGVLVGGRF